MAAEVRAAVDAELFQPARPRRAFDEIITQIRALIDDGQLKAGDRLPAERALAVQFAVSRNTVREALRMLEISGLIVLRRGAQGGAFITEPEPQGITTRLNAGLALTDFSLQDLTDCMRWLCELTVRVAAPLLTADDFDELEANLTTGAQLSDSADRERRALVLVEFYNILARATGNAVLVLLVESLMSVVRGVIPRLATPDHTFVVRSRRRLLGLLREGDVDAAVAELDRYLVRLHARWLKSTSNAG